MNLKESIVKLLESDDLFQPRRIEDRENQEKELEEFYKKYKLAFENLYLTNYCKYRKESPCALIISNSDKRSILDEILYKEFPPDTHYYFHMTQLLNNNDFRSRSKRDGTDYARKFFDELFLNHRKNFEALLQNKISGFIFNHI